MPQTLDDFTTLLARSRLHSAEAARTLMERWRKEAGADADPGDFPRWLVTRGHLTGYQASLLSQGHTEGLFVGPYKILDRIGEGRMAGVFRAIRESDAEPVAIKVLPPSRAKNGQTLARFQREAKLALALNHPGVVRALQAGEANGVHYLVMEHLEGGTLQELLAERGRLPFREAVRIAFLTALGLQHVHEKGLVHRDLKPGNLMLCPRPKTGENTLRSVVKILDIGLGRKLFDPSDQDDPDQWVTADGVTLGTPDYLSPEQATDARSADIRSDIYSLGCTLYHMLAGLPPFAGKNPVQKAVRHVKEPPRPLRDLVADLPEGLERVVSKMLAKDPGQRYATPAETAEALKPFLGAEAAPPRVEPTKPPSKASNRPMVAAKPEGAGKVPEGIPVDLRGKRPPAGTPGKSAGPETDVDSIDVEAVSAADLVMEFLRFPSRDVLMLVLGALAGSGLVALVWLLVALFGGGDAGQVAPTE